jgi:hypothetical protein
MILKKCLIPKTITKKPMALLLAVIITFIKTINIVTKGSIIRLPKIEPGITPTPDHRGLSPKLFKI